jgi:hypothetical protein
MDFQGFFRYSPKFRIDVNNYFPAASGINSLNVSLANADMRLGLCFSSSALANVTVWAKSHALWFSLMKIKQCKD